MTAFIAHRADLGVVGSTNDVVRDWLAAGVPEVCLAVADEQTAGRGRDGRSWHAPAGAAVLLSLGFRPTWLAPERTWQLAASISLAMADAAEAAVGLAPGTIALKWPNDLVTWDGSEVRKVAGVLGESDGLGTDDPRVVIGIGVNGDWPATAFPAALAGSMTSLRALAGEQPIDRGLLVTAFLERLEAAIDRLRAGTFAARAWADRQVTTGRLVELIAPGGGAARVRAIGVDDASGALIVGDDASADGRRAVIVGEIRHVRLAPATPAVSSVGV